MVSRLEWHRVLILKTRPHARNSLFCPDRGSQKRLPGFPARASASNLERLSGSAGIDLIHYGTEAEEETIVA